MEKGQNPFLGQGPTTQRRSEKLEELIDQETQEIIASCYNEARRILSDHRSALNRMAQVLLEKEKIDDREIQDILGPRRSSEEKPEAGAQSSEFKDQPAVLAS